MCRNNVIPIAGAHWYSKNLRESGTWAGGCCIELELADGSPFAQPKSVAALGRRLAGELNVYSSINPHQGSHPSAIQAWDN
jgi:hypothetical protein